jgi:hypothetical protein
LFREPSSWETTDPIEGYWIAGLVGRFAVGHGAHHGDLVRNLRGILHVLRKFHAGDLRIHGAERPAVFDRGEGLRIPRLLMGAAAGQVDMDQRLRLGFELRSSGDLFGAQLEEVAHGQAEAADEAGKDEFTTGGAAEMRRIFEPGNGFDFFAHRIGSLAGIEVWEVFSPSMVCAASCRRTRDLRKRLSPFRRPGGWTLRGWSGDRGARAFLAEIHRAESGCSAIEPAGRRPGKAGPGR